MMTNKTITDEQLERMKAMNLSVEEIEELMDYAKSSAEHAISCYEAIFRGEEPGRM